MIKDAYLIKEAGAKIKLKITIDPKSGETQIDTFPNPDAPKACDAIALAVQDMLGMRDSKEVADRENIDDIDQAARTPTDQQVNEIEEEKRLRIQGVPDTNEANNPDLPK